MHTACSQMPTHRLPDWRRSIGPLRLVTMSKGELWTPGVSQVGRVKSGECSLAVGTSALGACRRH
jgi:hypothetical protein